MTAAIEARRVAARAMLLRELAGRGGASGSDPLGHAREPEQEAREQQLARAVLELETILRRVGATTELELALDEALGKPSGVVHLSGPDEGREAVYDDVATFVREMLREQLEAFARAFARTLVLTVWAYDVEDALAVVHAVDDALLNRLRECLDGELVEEGPLAAIGETWVEIEAGREANGGAWPEWL